MTEKTEWEVVDEVRDKARTEPRQTIQDLMKTLLGPWWRWKLAGTATVAGLAIVFFATLTGMIALLLSAAAIVSIGIGKLRQWWRRDYGAGALIKQRQKSKV